MIQLKCNGKVFEVGGDELMTEFEDRIEKWNTESSGWDEHGNLWSVKNLPDIIEYGGPINYNCRCGAALIEATYHGEVTSWECKQCGASSAFNPPHDIIKETLSG